MDLELSLEAAKIRSSPKNSEKESAANQQVERRDSQKSASTEFDLKREFQALNVGEKIVQVSPTLPSAPMHEIPGEDDVSSHENMGSDEVRPQYEKAQKADRTKNQIDDKGNLAPRHFDLKMMKIMFSPTPTQHGLQFGVSMPSFIESIHVANTGVAADFLSLSEPIYIQDPGFFVGEFLWMIALSLFEPAETFTILPTTSYLFQHSHYPSAVSISRSNYSRNSVSRSLYHFKEQNKGDCSK
ncbi:hypothetical protein ACTFIW_012059 [Dictyostelium discoideum]